MGNSYTSFDKECMKLALLEAKKAYTVGEVPVGAVLAHDNKIIFLAHNLTESSCDATCHAELLCIRGAAKTLGNWRLVSSTLYTTLEPCTMCAGAAILSRVKKIIWGCPDLRQGSNGSWQDIFKTPHPIHQVEIQGGLLADESSQLLKDFFKERRKQKPLSKVT